MDTTPPPESGSDSRSGTPASPRAFLRRAAEALEQSPLKDVQRNMRALAHSAAGRLDLVTRDEFDALQAMLNASAQRVAQLEAQVAALESHLAAARDQSMKQGPMGAQGSSHDSAHDSAPARTDLPGSAGSTQPGA